MRPKDARHLAGSLLAEELPRRWGHVQGVAARVEEYGFPAVELLLPSAWLHDVGYASGLVETGFHPIDGARYLRRQGVDDRIVNLVAHHSCAHVEAGLRGLLVELEGEFPRDSSLPHDELCLCDMTTSPDGEAVTVHVRIAEIRQRYPVGHVTQRFLDLAEGDLVQTVEDVQGQLRAGGHPR